MSTQLTVMPPAGWYPDPSGEPQQRWWDGYSWSAHVQAQTAPVPVQPVAVNYAPSYYVATPSSAPAADEAYAPRAARPVASDPIEVILNNLSTGSASAQSSAVSFISETGTGPVPVAFAEDAVQVQTFTAGPKGWGTGSIWGLAFMPIISTVIYGAAFALLATVGIDWIGLALIPVLVGLISLNFAVNDRRGLDAKGYEKTANWAWVLLGDWVYLIVRFIATRREFKASSAFIWVYLANAIVAGVAVSAIVSLVGVPFLQSLAR